MWDKESRIECNKHEGTFPGDVNILYLHWSGVYMRLYICQNLLNFTLKEEHFIICKLCNKKLKIRFTKETLGN